VVSTNGAVFSALGGGLSGGTPSVNAGTNWRNVLIACGSFTGAPDSNLAGYGSLPLTPELIAPPEAITGLSVTPDFSWATISTAHTYKIQIARDANFSILTFNDSSLTGAAFSVPDSTPLLNLTTYFWRVNSKNGLGSSPFSVIRFFTTGFLGVVNNNEIPLAFNLYQNYPNPFNPKTKIKFDLPLNSANSRVILSVFNINGEKISDIVNTDYTAGKWEIDYDASGLASGVYFYSVSAGEFKQTNKMVLIK
jgi:hypothetical protein